jgi:type II secretory pathway pseudopilin PulG
MPIGKRRQAGFTYVGLLIAVVFFGLASVGAARLLASTERAEREAELLFIGHQFRAAIRSYLEAGPKAGQYPANLDDLLQDKRYPTPRRHLRRLFIDPITGNSDWGLVMAPEGGIMGVNSLSEREPQKRASFDVEDADFELALQRQQSQGVASTSGLQAMTGAAPAPLLTQSTLYSYRDWKFVYRPPVTGGARQPSGGG